MRVIRFPPAIEDVEQYRQRSKGWMADPPAYIHPRILFGSGVALTPEFAERHSISHVLNCAFHHDCPPWFPERFPTRYHVLNAIDSVDANILHWYPEFEYTLQQFLQQDGCRTIYVHCQAGMNRSGFLCLAYVKKKLGWNFHTAAKSILSQRPCALTNPSYWKQVSA